MLSTSQLSFNWIPPSGRNISSDLILVLLIEDFSLSSSLSLLHSSPLFQNRRPMVLGGLHQERPQICRVLGVVRRHAGKHTSERKSQIRAKQIVHHCCFFCCFPSPLVLYISMSCMFVVFCLLDCLHVQACTDVYDPCVYPVCCVAGGDVLHWG